MADNLHLPCGDEPLHLAQCSGGGGCDGLLYAVLAITCPEGCSLSVTTTGYSFSHENSPALALVAVPYDGEYTVTATLNGASASATVTVDGTEIYEVIVNFYDIVQYYGGVTASNIYAVSENSFNIVYDNTSTSPQPGIVFVIGANKTITFTPLSDDGSRTQVGTCTSTATLPSIVEQGTGRGSYNHRNTTAISFQTTSTYTNGFIMRVDGSASKLSYNITIS